MANETLAREVDAHIVTILSRLSALRENNTDVTDRKVPMSVEARSLELWRAVAVECLATFLFSLVVAGAAAASAVSGSGLSALATAVASGFAIAAISLIFSHISGGHVNPAVSVSFALCRRISPLRSVLYVAAQCGGGIAGAAMLYGYRRTRKACGPSKTGLSFLPSVRTAAGIHYRDFCFTLAPGGATVHRLAAAADVSPWTEKDRAEKGTREAVRREVGQVSRHRDRADRPVKEDTPSSESGGAATAEADVPAVAEIIVRSSLRSALWLLSLTPNDVPHQIWLYPSRRVSVLSAPAFRILLNHG
ncbi:Neurogenic protein big brain [Cyphomyrmex costatus]|uniref:Neurogenic protein big brain n=1 Tax=Cyphomyrmex costatus TaxID=456900 RepID=A0A195CLE0_9HYME|nr:Neurogenic protein big brain [Cyphomyrmex costatus]